MNPAPIVSMAALERMPRAELSWLIAYLYMQKAFAEFCAMPTGAMGAARKCR